MIGRRSFLVGLIAAPSIVRAASLMHVKSWIEASPLAPSRRLRIESITATQIPLYGMNKFPIDIARGQLEIIAIDLDTHERVSIGMDTAQVMLAKPNDVIELVGL